VATLTAGLNFNPGYLAQIPVGSDLPDESLCHAVDTLVALRHEMVARDPSHEGFQDVPSPWRDDLSARLATATMELDVQVGRHLGLASAVADQLPVLVEPRRVVQRHEIWWRRRSALRWRLPTRSIRGSGFDAGWRRSPEVGFAEARSSRSTGTICDWPTAGNGVCPQHDRGPGGAATGPRVSHSGC
jgi:hypothetical protein